MLEAILRAFTLLTLWLPPTPEPVTTRVIPPAAVVDQLEEYQWKK